MTDCSFDDFRGDIVRCAAHCPLFLVDELEFGGEPEIANFEIHVIIEEDVPHFKIAVDDSVAVHVLQGRNNLVHIVSCLFDGEFLPLFYHFAESLVGTEFQDYVDVLLVFEDGIKFYDVLLVQRLVNLDFGEQLGLIIDYFLFGPAFLEGGLVDHLDGIFDLGFEVDSLITLGEPTCVN